LSSLCEQTFTLDQILEDTQKLKEHGHQKRAPNASKSTHSESYISWKNELRQLRLILLASAISFSVVGIPNSLHKMYTAAVSTADTDLPRVNPLS
jgi:hypothetical protein